MLVVIAGCFREIGRFLGSHFWLATLIVGWMFYPMTFGGYMLAIIIGGGVGALAALRRACAYEYPLIASVGQITFSMVYVGWIHIFPFMFCTALGVWLGAAHALNRADLTES